MQVNLYKTRTYKHVFLAIIISITINYTYNINIIINFRYYLNFTINLAIRTTPTISISLTKPKISNVSPAEYNIIVSYPVDQFAEKKEAIWAAKDTTLAHHFELVETREGNNK